MKRYSYLIFLVLVLIVMTGCSMSGPSLPGGVQGYVYIRSGSLAQELGATETDSLVLSQSTPPPGYQPLSGATVWLARTSESRRTAHDGFFYFGGLTPGWYTIKVSDDSMRFELSEEVRVYSGRTTYLDRADSLKAGIGHYIIIGIDDYLYEDEPLYEPVEDALAVFEALFLENQLAAYGELLISRNHPWNDGMPTKQRIKQSIDNAIAMANNSSDYLVIYFSGISGVDFLSPWDDDGSPHESQIITDVQLEQWVRDFPGNVTLIVDGGNSATMADGSLFRPFALQKSMEYTVLASAKDGQKARGDRRLGDNSVFTHFLVEGIRTRAADRPPKNEDITTWELYEYVKGRMEWYHGYYRIPDHERQEPDIFGGRHGGSVLFRY